MVSDGLVYHFVPIDISFDIAGNHFLSTYNTVVVFLTALVAYIIIERSYQSPISIFSKARDQKEKIDVMDWEDMTEEEKDIDSAIKLWEKWIPETTIPTTPAASDNNPTSDNNPARDDNPPGSATDFKIIENGSIQIVRMKIKRVYESILLTLYFCSDSITRFSVLIVW